MTAFKGCLALCLVGLVAMVGAEVSIKLTPVNSTFVEFRLVNAGNSDVGVL